MQLDDDRCYAALRTHDPRFDERFFVAVSSTRIYCRPVCTAKAPRREHCRFYPSAALAEAHGYRPCLRCRPELAPGNARIDASRNLAARVADLIEEGALGGDGAGLEALAGRLGVSDRHLRRVFESEFGVAPVAFAQTQRLLLAKRLLTDTRLPMIDVALASGFSSVRRFNTLFQQRYRLAPTQLRKQARTPRAPDGFTFTLRYEPPFDWSSLVEFLSNRAIDGVEHATGSSYRRTVAMTHRGSPLTGWIDVTHLPGSSAVQLRASASLARVLPQVVGRVKRVFDLRCPIAQVEAALGPLAASRRGLRVPGAFDGFEMTVRAILGQQVSVKAARTLASRMAALGDPIDTGSPDLTRVFPTAARIAALGTSGIQGLGVVSSRARAIIALADEVAAGRIVLEPGIDVVETMNRLKAIPGIGEWTAEYVAMRALAWPDAFPASDLGVMRALGVRTVRLVREQAERWQPWRSYAVMHLWCGGEPAKEADDRATGRRAGEERA